MAISKAKCIVPECRDYRNFKAQVLPNPGKDYARYVKWLTVVDRRDLLEEDQQYVYRNKRICRQHFSSSCYYPNYEKLKPTAIPDLLLPNVDSAEAASSIPSRITNGDTSNRLESLVKDLELDNTFLEDESHPTEVNEVPAARILDGVLSYRTLDEDAADRTSDIATVDRTSDKVFADVRSQNIAKKHSPLPERIGKGVTTSIRGDRTSMEHTAEDIESYNEVEIVTVVPDLPVASGETSTTRPHDGTAQNIDRFARKPHVVQVLGSPNFQDPSVIKSVLDKVELKKQGSVYVVPLKKSKGRPKPLTRNLIEHAIQSLPAVNFRIKEKLLSIIRGLPGKPKQMKKLSKHASINNAKEKSIKKCTCMLHCNKYLRRKPVIKVSPVAYAKLDGQFLKGDMQQSFPDDSVFEVENIFTVSTILTNVNDKSQIEQLCQLLIESLFKLKNVNTDGVMSKLVVYFSQGINTSSQEASGTTKTAESGTTAHPQQTVPPQESSNTGNSSTKQQKTSKNEPVRKHVCVNLNAIHDHSYLSQESQVLFDKPQYLVNLVNIDTYKSSKKKTKILKIPPKVTPKKMLNEITKLRRYILRLKEFLKKKNERIENMNVKIKYLGSTLCQEKGLKRIKYPKMETNTEIGLNDKSENFVSRKKGIHSEESGSEIKEKRKKRQRKHKVLPSLYPISPRRNFENIHMPEIVSDNENENFRSEKREINNFEETGSEIKVKRKRRRKKPKIVLTPDFVLPTQSPVTPSRDFEHIQIHDMNFEDRFDGFCESLIEECVEDSQSFVDEWVDDSLSMF